MEEFKERQSFRSWSINDVDIGTPEQIESVEKKFDEVRYQKGFLLKGFHVDTYDLTDDEDIKRYVDDYSNILMGQYIGTHFLLNRDKRFVENKAGWIVNMEWVEFEVRSEIRPNIATAEAKKE